MSSLQTHVSGSEGASQELKGNTGLSALPVTPYQAVTSPGNLRSALYFVKIVILLETQHI